MAAQMITATGTSLTQARGNVRAGRVGAGSSSLRYVGAGRVRVRRILVKAEKEPSSADDKVNPAPETVSKVVDQAPTDQAPAEAKGEATYVDELPPVKQAELSSSMKDKMRAEYLGLGGAENTKMGANYFLWIIVVISALAVASWLSGAI